MAYHRIESVSGKGTSKSPNYARVDYGRFSESVPEEMPIGEGFKIGKVEVTCRFLFSKSKWGRMHKKGQGHWANGTYPAGILYLDLDFSQPPNCKLQSATVSVTVGQDDEQLHTSGSNVFMTGSYGPKQLRGPPKSEFITQYGEVMPQIDVGGIVGIGGMGGGKEKHRTNTDCWRFSGHLKSVNGCRYFNRLVWKLHENSLEDTPSHGTLFHTAFAVGHNARPFHLTVGVNGTLARKWDKLKSKTRECFTFGGSKHQPQNEAAIKFQWSRGYASAILPYPLNDLAKDLAPAMEAENVNGIPVVVSEAQPATYYPDTEQKAAHNTRASVDNDEVNLPTVHSNPAERITPRLQLNTPPRLLGMTDLPNLMSSTQENLARAGGFEFARGSATPLQVDSPGLLTRSVISSGTTLVDHGQDSESPWESGPEPTRTMERHTVRSKEPDARKEKKDGNLQSDEPTIKSNKLLGLLWWLQGITIWELICAILGVAALPGKAVRMKEIEEDEQQDSKSKNVRILPSGQRQKQLVENSDTEMPFRMEPNRAWNDPRKVGLKRPWN